MVLAESGLFEVQRWFAAGFVNWSIAELLITLVQESEYALDYLLHGLLPSHP